MPPSNQGGRRLCPRGLATGPDALERSSTRQAHWTRVSWRSTVRRRPARSGNPVGGVRYRDLHGAMRPMTGLDEAESPQPSPAGLLTRPLRPYAEIFTIPGAWRFSAAGSSGGCRCRCSGWVPSCSSRPSPGSTAWPARCPRSARSATRSALPGRPGGGLAWPAARPAPAARGVHRGHRAAHRGRAASAADLGILRAGGDRGLDHAVAGRDGPGALERAARGLAPAARRVLLRVGRRRAVLHHRPGRGDAARDRGLPRLRRRRRGRAVPGGDAVVRRGARHRAGRGPARAARQAGPGGAADGRVRGVASARAGRAGSRCTCCSARCSCRST